MFGLKQPYHLLFIIIISILSLRPALAETVQVRMLDKGVDGPMVFEPALVVIHPGDSVHFIPTSKGHNVETISGVIPTGAFSFSSNTDQDIIIKFDKQGMYGLRCAPHYILGMVALVVVGKPVNEDAIKAAQLPARAKERINKLIAEYDAGHGS